MNKTIFSKQRAYHTFLLFLCFSVFALNLHAQQYPFTTPNTINASINIQTSDTEIFNNKLIGYNIEGFNTQLEKDFIKKVDPVTIRFPHGVWANFYEWQDDTYQQDSYDNGTHQNSLNVYVQSIKGHIGGIASLNTDKKNSNGGQGYDMMWTYTVNFDDGASSVARAKKDIALGLEVKAIELGNEHFWKNQRANRTATPAMYLAAATEVSNALKAEFPDIELSIPLGWRRTQEDYNNEIIGDGNYFDAITLHKYLGADPDIPGESDSAYSSLLTAKLELEEDVNWVRDNFAPGKPIWLTEWGVSAGSQVHGGACLGLADVYMYMSEHQDIFERANWFSFNRILNAMVVVDDKRRPVYPLQKRGYLSTYEIIQDVFRDATMHTSTVTASAQLTTARGSVNAVNARATTKNGETKVIAVNLTDKPVTFELKFDNVVYNGQFNHEALIFEDLGVVAPVDYDSNQLQSIKQGTGAIILPPLSVSKISGISLAPLQAPTFVTPTDFATIEPGNNIEVEATVQNGYNTMNTLELFINGVSVRSTSTPPFTWGFDGQNDGLLENITPGTYELKLVLTDISGKTAETTMSVSSGVFPTQPYNGTIHTIPGTIQLEDYDIGGEGVAFSDSSVGNSGGAYRTATGEDVDITTGGTGFVTNALSGGEYTRYTVTIAETGEYEMLVHYRTNSDSSKPFEAAIKPRDLSSSTTLFTTETGSTTSGIRKVTDGSGAVTFGDYTSETFSLTKGVWILELKIPSGGAGPLYDYVTINNTQILSIPTPSISDQKLKVYPIPSTNGRFNLSVATPWKIYSLIGAEILQGDENLVDLSNFSKGIYILRTESGVIRKLLYN